jgi:hypothetical protein
MRITDQRMRSASQASLPIATWQCWCKSLFLPRAGCPTNERC